MGPSITLSQAGLTIGDNTLLKPADLTFEAGKLHLLTGPNGAGKSSLLKSMMGLMPHSGEIHWQWPGKASLPAYIPQLAAFDATLPITIEDYLHASIHTRAFFLKKSKTQKQRLQSLLEQVGLQDKTQRKLGQLSGGERQRLLFARALAQDTTLWFMDEPMTGLDQDAQQTIEQLILQLKAQRCTLVMVHHDHDFVRRHADQVVVVNQGIERSGSPEQIYGTGYDQNDIPARSLTVSRTSTSEVCS